MVAIILLNGTAMATSDGSGMDPSHRQRDIISRIINNVPYASHRRWQAEALWKSPPRAMVRSPGTLEAATGARASETFTSFSQRLITLAKLCNNLYKNTMFQEIFFSVARLKICFNGKQLHPFCHPSLFFPSRFLFWKHAFWIFNSSFVEAPGLLLS